MNRMSNLIQEETPHFTLGLDLGSNSIGWALIDEPAGTLIGIGVRVFPEGVNRDTTGGELSKNEERRIARGMRRQIARRARRKALLRKSLIECGLLPSNPQQQQKLDKDDPYLLRSRAIREELTPHEIGRLLIHLNQHRGFLSNRKADRSKAKENSEMLAQINELDVKMGDQTLGEFLAAHREANPDVKIRGQHTRRSMYLSEFERIWETQRQFHPELLSNDLKFGRCGELKYPRTPEPMRNRNTNSLLAEYGIHGIMFFQRSLYWPKSVIGVCELEPKQKRCEKADRLAQRFRLLNEVNNLRILPQRGEPRGLDPIQRDSVIAFLSEKEKRTFDELRRRLGLLDGDGFNLEAGGRKKLQGMVIDSILAHKDLFGSTWKKRADIEKTQIVRSLIEDDEFTIIEKATTDWGCTPELAEKLIDTDLGEGYMSYSRVAIEKLLPHLEDGLPLSSGDDLPSALSAAGYLRPDQRVVNQRSELPLVPDDIVNPLVRQALFEVRKVVNAIIREYGMPAAIHIEMARQVKGTSESRRKDVETMRRRERIRSEAAEQIRELGFRVSRDAIERFLLWREQHEECMYSGSPISPAQLFAGEVDIDHILPYSRSLDNSLSNKVVAFRAENHFKGQRTPYEWLSGMDETKFEAILQRAGNLPYEVRNAKRQKLQQKTVELNEFLSRQLNDTAYITKKVREYVAVLGCDVIASKGQCTAELRHMWGLDTVLRDDGLKIKNRDDHRHHAVDALVIALTDRSRLTQLARVRGTSEQLAAPWLDFRNTVEEVAARIKVSHRVSRKVAGALHEETIYGATSKPLRQNGEARPHAKSINSEKQDVPWRESEGEFVYRKPLEGLTPAMIDDIRDPQVKALVVARLRQFGIEPGSKDKISKEVWKEALYMTRKEGRKSAKPSQIRKVRIVKRDLTIRPIRNGTAYVKPGSTHHICIFELPESTLERPKRVLLAVSMLDAIARVKRREPVIQRVHPLHPEAKFVMSLSRGETVWATIKGSEDLFVFRTAASTQGQIYFLRHVDARPSKTAEKFVANANSLNAIKVTVDVLGSLRNAND